MLNKISIIVPIYNVERYLADCLIRVTNQTYANLEIILVNDGSTDTCPEICGEFALKDPRIKVIHKANGGLSDARNAGFSSVTGEYVAFVDSDDLLSERFYEVMMRTALENNADIVECCFGRFSENSEIHNMIDHLNSVSSYHTEEALMLLMKENLKQVVWNKLYKKEVINGLLFEKGRIHEDEFWTYKVFGNAKKVVKISSVLYFYRQQSDSIMGKGYRLQNLDGLDAYEERVHYMKKYFPSLVSLSVKKLCLSSLYHYQKLTKNPFLDPNQFYRKMIQERAVKYNRTTFYKTWKVKEVFWVNFFMLAPNFCARFRNYLKIGI